MFKEGLVILGGKKKNPTIPYRRGPYVLREVDLKNSICWQGQLRLSLVSWERWEVNLNVYCRRA